MIVEIKVIPNAKRQEIKRESGTLKVKVISRAERGKANRELVEYLSAVLGVKKADIKILRGEKDTRKVISLPLDEAELDTLFPRSP
ncbi:MAG TPA: hypothetical protein DCR97_14230 [Deltaproteobacteria bacterium]|nr:hypothetical protein [Deltaproteobacteria bacterium]